MKSLADQMYSYLIDRGKPLSSSDLVHRFFKIEAINTAMADKIITPLLQDDGRFSQDQKSHWHAVKTVPMEKLPVTEIPFVLFYIAHAKEHLSLLATLKGNLSSWLQTYASFTVYKGGMVEKYTDIKRLFFDSSHYVFIPYDQSSLFFLKKLSKIYAPLPSEFLTLSIRSLMHVLFPEKKFTTWEDVAASFDLLYSLSDDPASKVTTAVSVFTHLINAAQNDQNTTLEQLLALTQRDKKAVDFSQFDFDKEFLSRIPELPGVYTFLNKQGSTIYAGKTSNLRYRINSYFRNTGESIEKIKGILKLLYRISYTILGSDLEAIIEEYRLIEKYTPRFNTRISIPKRVLQTVPRIVLMPSRYAQHSKLYFIADGTPLIEYDLDCAADGAEIADILARIRAAKDYLFDPCKTLVISYCAHYGETINIIDIDTYQNSDAIIQALHQHCSELDKLLQEKKSFRI